METVLGYLGLAFAVAGLIVSICNDREGIGENIRLSYLCVALEFIGTVFGILAALTVIN